MYQSFKPQKKNKAVLSKRRALAEGRGSGSGANYEPFLQVRRGDFPSHGLSKIGFNPHSDTQHHGMSVLENQVLLTALHLGARQIRTQYALLLEDNDGEFRSGCGIAPGTLSLASRMGIRHPQICFGEPQVQTLDTLVTHPLGDHYAVFIRYEKDVPGPHDTRQYELLNLANLYWQERNCPFYILTEKDIDDKLIELLLWAYGGFTAYPCGASRKFLNFLRCCIPGMGLREQLRAWEAEQSLSDAVLAFKAAAFFGQIEVDLNLTKLPTIREAWKYTVVDEDVHKVRLEQFFASRVARHV